MSPSPPSAPSYSYESNWSSTALDYMIGMAIGALYWTLPYACLRILDYLENPTTDPDPPVVLTSNPNPNPNPPVLAASNIPAADSPVTSNTINPPFVVVRTYRHDLEQGGLDPATVSSNPNPNPPVFTASNVPAADSPVISNRINPPFVDVVRTYRHGLERGGLDPATISSYPRFPYSASRGGDDDVCSICLSEYTEGDMLRMMPCMHSFHLLCIDEWLRLKASCPLCRASC